MNIFEIIGWTGSALFIISYFLLSTNRLNAQSILYQLMNVAGGLCLVICAFDTKDRPNLFTNLIWMFIGIYATIKIIKRKKG
ncbi:CBU_0592 family membrane protein [Arenibacter arenosicollis]|uniref:CBU_0592 family membrane protein n=1 Tax=Arenibacter arenosicollis TaxID=2762274 RepID=UPI003CCDB503